MKVTYIQRGPGTWRLRLEVGRDEAGKRAFRYETVRGDEEAAQRRRFELLNAHDAGTLAVPEKVTVQGFFEVWLQSRLALGKITASSADTYRVLAGAYIFPTLGGHRIQKLRGTDIQGLYTKLAGQSRRHGGGKLAPATIRIVHAILAAVCGAARRQRLVLLNPMEEVEAPTAGRRPKPKALAPEQVPALLASLAGDWKEPITYLALAAELRRGEVLGLRWRDVDLDGAKLTVRGQLIETRKYELDWRATKTESGERAVALGADVVDRLRELRRQAAEARLRLGLGGGLDDAWVFTPDGVNPYRPGTLTRSFSRHCTLRGFPDFTFHGTRHTGITALLAKVGKAGVKAVSERAGHSDVVTTLRVYQSVFKEDDERLGAMSAELVKRRDA